MIRNACRFCGRRCLVFRVLPDQTWAGFMATCANGIAHDRAVTGHDHTTATDPLADPLADQLNDQLPDQLADQQVGRTLRHALSRTLGRLDELRGSMDGGYDDHLVNTVLGRISEITRLRLVCVWDVYDDSGVGGESQFYVEAAGRLFELEGRLSAWLRGDPNDSDTPFSAGDAASWIGPPADISVAELPWDDGWHNYARCDTASDTADDTAGTGGDTPSHRDTQAFIPATLAARPWHPQLKVPIPLMNVHTDERGTFVDFLGVDPHVAVHVARNRLCGACGQDLNPTEIAFLGRVESVQHRAFSDPPFHEDCARAALRLCPHLRVRHHRRAPEHRLHPDVKVPDDWHDLPRPDRWALGITHDYALVSVEGVLVFTPARFSRVHLFVYTGPHGTLTEIPYEHTELTT